GMAVGSSANLRSSAQDYMVRAVTSKSSMPVQSSFAVSQARAVQLWLIAAAAMIFLTLIVRDAADGIGPFHRRMEAGDRRAAADERQGLAGRVRGLQGDPAISPAQPWHE